MKLKRSTLLMVPAIALLIFVTFIWIAGGMLAAPANQSVGDPPADLSAEAVQFSSESGAQIRGWLMRGTNGGGAVVLMHGVRASRTDMLDRARFLSRVGYTVLLFDFQAHGESGRAARASGRHHRVP